MDSIAVRYWVRATSFSGSSQSGLNVSVAVSCVTVHYFENHLFLKSSKMLSRDLTTSRDSKCNCKAFSWVLNLRGAGAMECSACSVAEDWLVLIPGADGP